MIQQRGCQVQRIVLHLGIEGQHLDTIQAHRQAAHISICTADLRAEGQRIQQILRHGGSGAIQGQVTGGEGNICIQGTSFRHGHDFCRSSSQAHGRHYQHQQCQKHGEHFTHGMIPPSFNWYLPRL